MTCVRSVQLKKCLNKLVLMKSSNKVTTNYVCNCISCKNTSLPPIPYSNTSCENLFIIHIKINMIILNIIMNLTACMVSRNFVKMC